MTPCCPWPACSIAAAAAGLPPLRYLEDNVATYVPLDAPGPATYRRGVYHQNARAARVDVLTDFDCPTRRSRANAAPDYDPVAGTDVVQSPVHARNVRRLAAARVTVTPTDDPIIGPFRRAFALAYLRQPDE